MNKVVIMILLVVFFTGCINAEVEPDCMLSLTHLDSDTTATFFDLYGFDCEKLQRGYENLGLDRKVLRNGEGHTVVDYTIIRNDTCGSD